jgi:hypothetical protein
MQRTGSSVGERRAAAAVRCGEGSPARSVVAGTVLRVSDDEAGQGVDFEVALPIGGDAECVAHMFGDEATFRQRLESLMQSDAADGAVLSAPIPMSLSGPQTEEVQQALDRVGGASVRAIVPIGA